MQGLSTQALLRMHPTAIESPTSGLPHSRSDLRWLVRLRWVFVVAEILFVAFFAESGASMPLLVSLVLAHALSNVIFMLAGARLGESVIAALFVDVFVLTALLRASGGATNPFSVVFLVQVTVAAVVLRHVRMWLVVAFAIVGYAALFVGMDPSAMHVHTGEEGAFDAHLQGMWIAFSVTAVGIAGFVSRLASELEVERNRADANARIMGMTTLAAGAAHELATPLATIKTVIFEIEHELRERGELSHVENDLALVRSEVERSRRILDRLSSAAGELRGEAPTPMPVRALEECLIALGEDERQRVVWTHGIGADEIIDIPRQALAQGLHALIHNALDASPENAQIKVHTAFQRDSLTIEVSDQGSGMDAKTLAQVGDPFFTTKDPGRGMGLGIFLVRALMAHLGGQLDVISILGKGTTMTMTLPSRGPGRVQLKTEMR